MLQFNRISNRSADLGEREAGDAAPAVRWDAAAEKALDRVPFFVRGMVRRKVEERVRKRGSGKVSLEDFKEAESRFRSVAAGKSDGELQQMLPRENRPGAEMVIVEVCHHELSNCPNVLIRTEEWKQSVGDWARKNDISERMREKVRGGVILYHHKFRISISGCPNGCSRPQIADVGLTGFVRPELNPGGCTSCGACAGACPDSAVAVDGAPPEFDLKACLGCLLCRNACPDGCISLSTAGARVMAGGRLGRHPRLAEFIGEVGTPEELIGLLDRTVGDYIRGAAPGERFADFRIQSREEALV